jgi:hypothetical protein
LFMHSGCGQALVMKFQINVVLAVAALGTVQSAKLRLAEGDKRAPLKETWPWYHSADDIHAAMQELVGNCPGAEVSMSQSTEFNSAEAAGQSIALDVVRIQRSGPQAKKKAMIVFGEHAREIISPETGLNFAKTLCGQGPEGQRGSKVLDTVSFTIVPNANPLGRKQVEDGYYCKRTNEDGVDLNRNFGDDHRDASLEKKGDETNAGPSGFSEPESKMLKSLVDDERPDIYLSVHSGAYLLGTPFGYTQSRSPENEDDMMEVLAPISQKTCNGECPYGNLAELIHYDSPGCDIDYVSERVGSPYVFTWEIYVGERYRGPYLEEARLRRQHSGDKDFLQTSFAQKKRRAERRDGSMTSLSKRLSKAWQKLLGPEDEELVDSCMDQFNPQSEEETGEVVAKWTGAFLALCENVVRHDTKKAAAKQSLAATSTVSGEWDPSALLAGSAN